MAMDWGSWNNLPSVILLEVFKYLPRNDTLSASATCTQWRQHLYHASLWRKLTFNINSPDERTVTRARYQASCFVKKLRSVTVKFDSLDPVCVEEAARVVKKLSKNVELRKFHLMPSNCHSEFSGHFEGLKLFSGSNGLQLLSNIISNSLYMEELTLGCMEDIISYSKDLLRILVHYQSSSLRVLGLASLKDDPDDYLLPELDNSLFRNFRHLQILSIDYDNLDDRLLLALKSGHMKRLAVHVHGIADSHPSTSDAAWKAFRHANPKCELRLSLIHSYDAVNVLHDVILRPSMPLTHLRAFFCEQINLIALQEVSMWYSGTLRSIQWVDSLQSAATNALIEVDEMNLDDVVPNPLIMCAWKCSKLEEIALIGYKIFDYELFALFRLRRSLRRLDVWEGDIVLDQSINMDKLEENMSNELGGVWKPRDHTNLDDVILNPDNGDSDEYILPFVESDLKA